MRFLNENTKAFVYTILGFMIGYVALGYYFNRVNYENEKRQVFLTSNYSCFFILTKYGAVSNKSIDSICSYFSEDVSKNQDDISRQMDQINEKK